MFAIELFHKNSFYLSFLSVATRLGLDCWYNLQQYFTISWQSVLLLKKTSVPEKTTFRSQVTDKLSHIHLWYVLLTIDLELSSQTLVVICTDWISRWISHYLPIEAAMGHKWFRQYRKLRNKSLKCTPTCVLRQYKDEIAVLTF